MLTASGAGLLSEAKRAAKEKEMRQDKVAPSGPSNKQPKTFCSAGDNLFGVSPKEERGGEPWVQLILFSLPPLPRSPVVVTIPSNLTKLTLSFALYMYIYIHTHNKCFWSFY